jgi:hypothetical protein
MGVNVVATSMRAKWAPTLHWYLLQFGLSFEDE